MWHVKRKRGSVESSSDERSAPLTNSGMAPRCETIREATDTIVAMREAGENPPGLYGGFRRIMHVVAPGIFGGLESVVCALGDAQREAGHDPHVAAIIPSPGNGHPFLSEAMSRRIATHTIKVSNRGYLRERSLVSELYQDLCPDVVHLHGYHAAVVDGPVVRRLGACTVVTVHGFTGKDWKNRIYERLLCRECRRADAAVAVSRPLFELLVRKGVRVDHLHTVLNGWSGNVAFLPKGEARRYLGLPDSGFIVGWVGRLSHEKGADVLIDAVARIPSSPLVVSIVGDGPLRGRLMHKAQKCCPHIDIHWHGAIPGAARLFAAFDLLVLSSRTEGTPIVLLEAMAAQVPIVAFEVGGVPDMLSANDAIIVKANDCSALAAAIQVIRQDQVSASARAAHAHRRLVEEFDRRSWVTRYDRVYDAAERHCRTRNLGTERPCKPIKLQLSL